MMPNSSDSTSAYPLSDTPLTLPSGVVVRVRNRVVFRGTHTTRLTIVIETPTPPTAVDRLADEARELADLLQRYAPVEGLDGITIMICRTRPCLEMRERSDEMFHFLPDGHGHWRPDRSHGS